MTAVASVLVAALILGGLWFLSRRMLAPQATATRSDVTTSPEPWPTVPPTFTPAPTATIAALPSPTPLPIPSWEPIGELATVAYYDQFDSEKVYDDWAPGKDRALVQVVAQIKMGIDLGKVTSSAIQANGRSIRVRLPPLQILNVSYVPERSKLLKAEQQYLLSRYPGLEKQAIDTGLAELRDRASRNDAMIALAMELTRYRVEQLLHRYGYQTVEVGFGTAP